MSQVEIYQNRIGRISAEIERLKRDRLSYLKKKVEKSNKIAQSTKTLRTTRLASTISAKQREIDRYQKELLDMEKKIADYDKKIIAKEKELHSDEAKLLQERRKLEKKLDGERKKLVDSLNERLENQESVNQSLKEELYKLKEAQEKINILFLAACPSDEMRLKLDKEAREIHGAIQKTLKRDSINFQTRWATRITDILQSINEVRPTIIHFSGHGCEDGSLVFQDNNDNAKLLKIEDFVQLIYACNDDVRLVVLNNCYSSVTARELVTNIEAAIGMNDSVEDEAAITFASQLYSSIGFGLNLEKAFKQSLVQMKLLEVGCEDIPELYVKDGLSADEIILVCDKK